MKEFIDTFWYTYFRVVVFLCFAYMMLSENDYSVIVGYVATLLIILSLYCGRGVKKLNSRFNYRHYGLHLGLMFLVVLGYFAYHKDSIDYLLNAIILANVSIALSYVGKVITEANGYENLEQYRNIDEWNVYNDYYSAKHLGGFPSNEEKVKAGIVKEKVGFDEAIKTLATLKSEFHSPCMISCKQYGMLAPIVGVDFVHRGYRWGTGRLGDEPFYFKKNIK